MEGSIKSTSFDCHFADGLLMLQELLKLDGRVIMVTMSALGVFLLLMAGAAPPPSPPAPKPRVLLLGDSIRLGYAPVVAKLLTEQALVISPKANGGDTTMLLQQLDALLQEHQPDIIVFNCGLHDLKKSKATGKHQVPVNDYANHLRTLVARLRQQTPWVLFATSTPILDERHAARKASFDRFAADVQKYNEQAVSIMKELKVPIVDLHAVVMAEGPEQMLSQDGTHYTAKGYDRLAKAVVDALQKPLASVRSRGK